MAIKNDGNFQRVRRARKAVLLGVLLFAVCQMAMLTLVEIRSPLYADPEYGFRLERLRTLRHQYPNRPSLVVLGSSRIGNGFESDYATRLGVDDMNGQAPTVANMSLTGGTGFWEYIMLKRLIYNGLKPDSIIVEIFPPSLLVDRQFFMESYHFPVHRLRYVDLFSLDLIMPELAPRHRQEWIRNNLLFPWHTHRFSLVGLCSPKWQVEPNCPNSRPAFWRQILSPTGWIAFGVASPTAEQRVEAEALAKKSYEASMVRLDVCGESKKIYEAIFRCCKENNIQVAAVVLMPESDKFRSWYTQQAEEKIDQFVQWITDDFGIKVVNARKWIPDDQFWDGHHLLPSGAEDFTTRICKELITEPLQASRPNVSTTR